LNVRVNGNGDRVGARLRLDWRRTLIRPRLLLADDHPSMLEATKSILLPYFDIVGTVGNGADLVREALRLSPDVVVTDVSMPVVNGINAIHELRASGSLARVVFLTIHSKMEFVEACMAEGALGYVQKRHMKAHLVRAIQAALAGQSYVFLS
jgi:DNA-binding NarL/FixJ family response regulator